MCINGPIVQVLCLNISEKFIQKKKIQCVSQNRSSPPHINFLNSGANPNVSNDDGESPLMVAARQSQEAKVEVLLEHGADPNAADRLGETPLMKAAVQGCQLGVEALLKYGAKPHLKNAEGVTATRLARVGLSQLPRSRRSDMDGKYKRCLELLREANRRH